LKELVARLVSTAEKFTVHPLQKFVDEIEQRLIGVLSFEGDRDDTCVVSAEPNNSPGLFPTLGRVPQWFRRLNATIGR
jgi:hypothetical protein